MTKHSIVSLLVSAFLALPADAADNMPKILTLDYVLQQAFENHPLLVHSQSQVQRQQAQLELATKDYDLRASLALTARYIEPSDVATDDRQNDSQNSLLISKRWYDFGRTRYAERPAQSSLLAEELSHGTRETAFVITLISTYFDVLLADLQFNRDNEAMATAYVQLDKARQRAELGQLSDVEVYRLESEYQKTRRLYRISSDLQRSSRAHLAIMLNRPGELVANVAAPKDLYVPKKLKELEVLLPYLEQNNPELKILKATVEAAQQKVDSARSRYWPTLDSQLELHEYQRDTPNRDKMRFSLTLNIPLWQGDSVSGTVARNNAQWREANARYQLRQMEIAQEFVEGWQAFSVLRIKMEEMLALMDFRDLKLDEARALYEMEVQTTLGRSMVDISDATWQLNKTKFQLVLHWLKLQALLGEPARLKQSEGVSIADLAGSTSEKTATDESSRPKATQEASEDDKK